MPRINLTISEELFSAIQSTANKQNIPINLVAISALEQLFLETKTDYSAILEELIKDIDFLPKDKEFVLYDLPTFKSISIASCKEGIIRPTALRARIGKAFNELVRAGKVNGITRATTHNTQGEVVLKFDHRAAVYRIDWEKRVTNDK